MKIAKKVFFIVLMIWLSLAIKVSAQTATAKFILVLREGASTSTEPIAEVQSDESVEIIEKTDNWYKVIYDGQTGFIREDLLDVPEEQIENKEETQEDNKDAQEQQENIQTQDVQKQQETNTTLDQEYIEYNAEGQKNTETKTALKSQDEKQVSIDIVGRIVPSLSASKLEKINAGTKVSVIKVLNAWSLIRYNENKTAWIPSKFLKEVEEETSVPTPESEPEPSTWMGYINVNEAIVRAGASLSADIIAEIYRNNQVEVIGEEGEWYKILFEGQEAYIAKRLVSTSVTSEQASRGQTLRSKQEEQTELLEQDLQAAQELTASVYESQIEDSTNSENIISEEIETEPVEEAQAEAIPVQEQEVATVAPASSRGAEVAETAKQYLGCSYVYGGSGPSSFDCSGFTMFIYSKFGVSMGHGATYQSNEGTFVSKENLQPGDLVIFRDWDNTSIGHCGIYIGEGNFIHAANPNRGVVTDTLNSGYYYERYVSGRRIV